MQVSVIAQIASHLCEYSHSAAKSVRHSANSFPFLHFIPIKNREPSVPSEHHRGAQRQLDHPLLSWLRTITARRKS